MKSRDYYKKGKRDGYEGRPRWQSTFPPYLEEYEKGYLHGQQVAEQDRVERQGQPEVCPCCGHQSPA